MWLLAYLMAGCVGLLLLLYPLISNELYENRQDGVIQEYTTIVTDTKQDQALSDALAAARSYNQQLATGILDADDPFLVPVLPTEDGTQKSILDVSGNGVIATLSIPKLGLELPVYYGTDGETLEHGIGTLEVSSLPVGGTGTHSVISAHSAYPTQTFFDYLTDMEVGDSFYIYVLDRVLKYDVDQIKVVLPNDTSNLYIEHDKDYMTLITCTPYTINTHRLLVRGKRVPYDPNDKRGFGRRRIFVLLRLPSVILDNRRNHSRLPVLCCNRSGSPCNAQPQTQEKRQILKEKIR